MAKRKRGAGGRSRPIKRRKRKRTYAKARIPKRTINVPNKVITKLKYCDTIQIAGNTTAGLAKSVFYKCNGCFDPQVSTGGHTPMGFTEWGAKYYHYKVIGSKIVVKATCSNAQYAANYPALALTRVNKADSGEALSVEPNTMREQAGTKFIPIEPNARGSYTASMGYSNKKTFGALGNAQTHFGSLTSDPSEGAYWRISNVPSADSETPNTLYLQITIHYTVMWVERKAQAGST